MLEHYIERTVKQYVSKVAADDQVSKAELEVILVKVLCDILQNDRFYDDIDSEFAKRAKRR